jgi:hypothetical protein
VFCCFCEQNHLSTQKHSLHDSYWPCIFFSIPLKSSMGDKWTTSGRARLKAHQKTGFTALAHHRPAIAPPAMLISGNLATNSAKSHPRLRHQSAEGKISEVSVHKQPMSLAMPTNELSSREDASTVAENLFSIFYSNFIIGTTQNHYCRDWKLFDVCRPDCTTRDCSLTSQTCRAAASSFTPGTTYPKLT